MWFKRGMRELEIDELRIREVWPINRAAEEIFAKWLLMLERAQDFPASVVHVNLVSHLVSWIRKICITVIYETTFFVCCCALVRCIRYTQYHDEISSL